MRRSNPNPPATLGERIRAVRKAWGWSQVEAARALHMDRTSISLWERGDIIPNGHSKAVLSSLFRLSVEALETGKGFVIPDPPSHLSLTNPGDLRSVSLPVGISDSVAVIDLGNGRSKGKQISEAMVDLVAATKAGRRIWLVVE